MWPKVKKFLDGYDRNPVDKKSIMKSGDWLLKWDPNTPSNTTGFELYTPKDFDPEQGGGPLGGLVLAAVYFLIEHGDLDFTKELIARANELSRQMAKEKSGATPEQQDRTLN